ncbi:MAG TPA: CDP-diacylglycerol--serine O-phosphatidyltransferase [Rhizomicrobium sp.]|jgi:CDP-diacylglycerol--serine O-phosphatidyltransferase|nr:CDP-diacylglycerol--serine O-phosphatidyltransferase [Rhizomicrobium sp.]
MNRFRRDRIAEMRDDMPFGKFIPSGLTLVGLCCGATSMRFAFSGQWKAAVVAIACAAIFDMLDGRAARLFGADSKFGAQLDSLADLVSFGIAPSVLVYMWTLYHANGVGWALTLIYCVCCAIRLARFNIEADAEHEDGEEVEPAGHFTGVPTPAAACLIMLPLLLSFQFSDPVFSGPILTGAMMALVSVLMVSKLHTFSFKKLRVPRHMAVPVMALVCIVLTSAVIWPWATLTAGLILYLATLPLGLIPVEVWKRQSLRLRRPPL